MSTTLDRETTGTGAYAEVNGINLYYETHRHRPADGAAARRPGLRGDVRADPADAGREHQVINVDLQGHGRTADIDRPLDLPAAGRRHRGADRPPRPGPARRRRLLLRRRRRLLDGGPPPGEGGQAGDGLRARAPERHPRRDAGPAGPGERCGGGVHEGHPDVRALPPGRAEPGGLPAAAGQDRRHDGAGLRLLRGAPRDRRCRPRSSAPTPTWRRPRTTSRCSRCSTAGCGTAAGWVRAALRAGTRSPCCRA